MNDYIVGLVILFMKSIRAKIMWLLFCGVFIASLIIGALGIILTSNVIRKSSTENMTLLCRNHADKIDIALAKVEESVETLVHFAESSLTDVEALKDDAYRLTYSAAIQTNALNHIESVSGAVAIYLDFSPDYAGTTDGFFYAKDNTSGEFVYQPLMQNAADAPFIPSSVKSATWYEAYYDQQLAQHIISYVVPVYKNKHQVSIIGIDVAVEYIENLVKEVSIYTSGQGAVLKSDGTVVYHPNFDRGALLGENDPGFDGVIEQLTRENSTKELISYQLKGEKKKLASCTLRNGMLMICFAPTAEIYHQQQMLTLANTVITVVVVLLSLLIAYLVSRKLVRPINNLNDAAKHLTHGEFDFDISIETRDEIAELAATFIETRQILKNQIHLLDKEAHRDGLTGVGNKSAYLDREQELDAQIVSGTADFSLVVFDVNRLKVTNDVFGHMAGDRLLLTFASYLEEVFGPADVYRLGGDEFVVILTQSDPSDRQQALDACLNGMRTLTVEGYPDCTVSCAYGYARLDTVADRCCADVLRRADTEMYKHKAASKQEAPAWQEGTKGIKQLQIEKYCTLMQTLKESTDDYLFLMNVESGYLQFFGGSAGGFSVADSGTLTDDMAGILRYVHPHDHSIVTSAVTAVVNHDTEALDMNFRMRNTNDATMRWVNCRGNIIKDETDSHFIMIGRISKNAVKHLYNPITTLFNKAKMKADLAGPVAKMFNHLLLLNIDRLSEINFKHGSAHGDALLKTLAEALERRFAMWQIYHTEKDHFVILLNIDTDQEAETIYADIQAAMEGQCSLSAAIVPNDSTMYINAETIYDYAVQQLNNGKKNGRGQLVLFSKENLMERLAAAELRREMEAAVQADCRGFHLVYQPQIRATDYSILGAEALLRYHSDATGPIYPDQFIPVLEETGLIMDVGMWVVEQALIQCKAWRAHQPNFKISVNVAPQQLEKRRTAAHILALLEQYELPGSALTLEITESTQLTDDEDVLAVLATLQATGIQIAIDDFGTGYSNLSHLKNIHANILKVDRMFIRDIKENGFNYNLIRNMLGFAKSNALQVCLEGVETKEELRVLSGLCPDLFQGYLFDKPCPAAVMEAKYFQEHTEEYHHRVDHTRQLHQEKLHAPIVNMEMRTILNSLNIGLWIVRLNTETGQGELYADATMRTLLGVENGVSSTACYAHWQRFIKDEHRAAVETMINEMTAGNQVVQIEYVWQHPQHGDIRVRCTGRRTDRTEDVLSFEGFLRVIDDMGKNLA